MGGDGEVGVAIVAICVGIFVGAVLWLWPDDDDPRTGGGNGW